MLIFEKCLQMALQKMLLCQQLNVFHKEMEKIAFSAGYGVVPVWYLGDHLSPTICPFFNCSANGQSSVPACDFISVLSLH